MTGLQEQGLGAAIQNVLRTACFGEPWAVLICLLPA